MKKLWVALVAMFFLAGCSASNMAQLETNDAGQTKTVLHSNNATLSGRLAVKDILTGRAGDMMKAQATLENRWKFRLDFQYKFKWFDKEGFELAPEAAPWQQLVLDGRTQANVKALAPDPRAVRFEIWVQD